MKIEAIELPWYAVTLVGVRRGTHVISEALQAILLKSTNSIAYLSNVIWLEENKSVCNLQRL
jgi:hypothetical protein